MTSPEQPDDGPVLPPGQLCRLRGLHDWVWRAPRASHGTTKDAQEWLVPLVLGVIVGSQPHTEEADRVLFFFHPTQLVLLWASDAGVKTGEDEKTPQEHIRYRRYHPPSSTAETAALGSKGELHRRSDVHMGVQNIVSVDGYVYRHDGWYDATDLEALSEEDVLARYGVSVRRVASDAANITTPSHNNNKLSVLPQAWVAAMDAASACCEVHYLCYAFRPWFSSAFESFPYLSLPERQLCYSAHLCHRCLTPFFSLDHLTVHLEAYCPHGRRPPGPLLYHDQETGRKIFYVDGGQHLHYGRCLSLLGKGFIESKLIQNDVDVYEFFVVTVPRQTVPFVASFSAEASEAPCPAAAASVKPEGDADEFSSAEDEAPLATSPRQDDARAFRAFVSRYDSESWDGDVVVGYFSRLKHQPHHALSCIVTLPCFQRMQLGTFMLDAAYGFAQERQRQCGCVALCGPAEVDGASISRPFSPHGQALLLAYWRRTLLHCLWQRHQQAQDKAAREETTGAEAAVDGHLPPSPVRADSLAELRLWLPTPISLVDLQFLFLHADFAFYAPSARKPEDGAASQSGSRHRRFSLAVSGTAAPPTAVHHEFTGTLLFDRDEVDALLAPRQGSVPLSDAASTLPGCFHRRWLKRLPDGQLVYNVGLFHH